MNLMPGAPATNRRLRVNLDPDGVFPTKCVGMTVNGPCRRPPVIGSPACHKHGAGLPNVRAAADRRVADLSAQRTLDATLARMNLDAPPIADPAAAMASLAGRLLSGFEGVQSRLNECREAGQVPSDVDLAERALWVKELRSLLTDMTRLQVGVHLASRYVASQDVQNGDLGADQGAAVLADLPDVSSIVAAVLETEHRLETDRLVKVEQARSMGVTQGQLPAELTIVGETEQAS